MSKSRKQKPGIISLKGKAADVKTPLPDGAYRDCISGDNYSVSEGIIKRTGKPVIIKYRLQ